MSSTLVGTTPAQAEVSTFEVTSTADSGPGSLRDALARAQASAADDQITFAPSVTGTILLTSGELDTTVGGTSGNLIIEGPGRDVLAVDAGGQSRVLDVHGPGGDTRPTVVVSGLTLTGGVSDRHDGTSSIADWYGGALRTTGADLVLERLAIAESAAFEGGGGIAVVGASLLVSASTITGNSAGSGSSVGGGIHFDDGEAAGTSLVVQDSTISDNTAGHGGGISVSGPAPVTVMGSTVSRNTASFTVTGFDVYYVDGSGGGIAADYLTLVDSRIADNEAGSQGGGLSGRSVVVIGSTIADNVAGDHGGGVHVGTYAGIAHEVRLRSSTITGNRAGYGGGLHVRGDMPVELRLSTVASNAAVSGGGLTSDTEVALLGTIVAMNTGGDLAGSGSAALDHSLVQDPRGFAFVDNGGSIIGEDPRLGPLTDNGGPTETLVPASNSPVIDRGSAFGSTTDQRGLARPVDDADTPDAADGSDIGAVELTQSELAGPSQVGNTARPMITGVARVGETLRTDGGTWEPEEASLSYQWLRDDVPIPGATSASYTLTSADYGSSPAYGRFPSSRVSVQVTAGAADHRAGSVVSDYTDLVRLGILRMEAPPSVVGRTEVGSVLRARPRLTAVSPRPRGVFVQWFLDGRSVDRAYGDLRYRLGPQSRGKRVEVSFSYRGPKAYRSLTRVVKKRRSVR